MITIISKSQQQIWGTIASNNKFQLQSDYKSLIESGVSAIEFRADLMPLDLLLESLQTLDFNVPIFIANFKVDQTVFDCFLKCKDYSIGFLFHLDHPQRNELIDFCKKNDKLFIAAYHSQLPLKYDDIIKKYLEQIQINPLLVKVGIRANCFNDAMEMISATKFITENTHLPVAGAVFGDERWSRLALHRAGSNVTFLIAQGMKNELGEDDKQFTLNDFMQLTSIV